MRLRPRVLSWLPQGLAFTLIPFGLSTVRAEDAAPARLPEVVVSAERVESTLRKTPVSVAVIGTDEIERKGLAQLSDMVGVVAGVSVPNGFSNMPQAVGIRGVGVSNPAMSQAVGIYIDDIPLVRGYATALWDLPDIVRIEVLRGPQGTLYGQNASAGAVKIVSRDPGDEATRWVSLSAGNHGALEAHGYANARLGDSGTAASVAFSRRLNDGFGYNATLDKDVNRLDATQVRVKLKQPLTPTLTAVLALDGLLDKSDTNTTNFPLNHPDTRPRVTYTADPALGAFRREAGGVQLRLEQRLGEATLLRAITGLRRYHDDPTSPDWGGLEQLRFAIDQDVEQLAFSQELQLQSRGELLGRPATWTTGVMLVHDRFDFVRFATSVPLATNTAQYTEAQTHLKTTDLGLYGQTHLRLTERLGATLGARAYHTRQTGANAFYRTDASRQRTTTVYEAPDLAFSKSGLLPRVGLDYQLSDAHLTYASLAQGAKFGGFNRAAESRSSALVATNPERVLTYELGAKSRWADGRLNTQLAAFYNDYRDYLASLNNTTINGVLVPDPVIINAGKAHTYGLDLEATALLTRDLVWSGSVEWLRSKFTDFANPTGAASADFVGHELPFAPRVSAGTTLAYTSQLDSGATVKLDLSAQYIRRHFGDVANSAALVNPSQVYLHLGGAYSTADGRWTFSLRVRNLTDRTYVLLHTLIPPLGINAGYYNAPRTVLLTAKYEFL